MCKRPRGRRRASLVRPSVGRGRAATAAPTRLRGPTPSPDWHTWAVLGLFGEDGAGGAQVEEVRSERGRWRVGAGPRRERRPGLKGRRPPAARGPRRRLPPPSPPSPARRGRPAPPPAPRSRARPALRGRRSRGRRRGGSWARRWVLGAAGRA